MTFHIFYVQSYIIDTSNTLLVWRLCLYLSLFKSPEDLRLYGYVDLIEDLYR